MSHLTRLEIRRRAEKSAIAAQKLTRVGMPVIVVRDDGTDFSTTLKTLPWKLAHNHWVCGMEGISGGYDCCRVRPA